MSRIVAHLDMDAFFAAVEERRRPHLRGKPIVVGADPEDGRGRGVVATANYAARRYGIRSAMPIGEAWRLAEAGRARGEPPVVWILPHGGYGEAGSRVMAIVGREIPVIERTSVDEAYLDLGFAGTFEKAAMICRRLKERIRSEEGLTASIGLAPNKLVAKIASDAEKPDGLTVVRPEEVLGFLAPLGVRAIPGIGPKTETVLRREGVRTVGDARRFSRDELTLAFGKGGEWLHAALRGEDERPVSDAYEAAKSIGAQETLREDTLDPRILAELLKSLATEAMREFRVQRFRSFRRVVLTVRFADFATVSRSRTLAEPGRTLETLEFEGMRLFLPFLDRRENPGRRKIRLVGVRMERLSEFDAAQPML